MLRPDSCTTTIAGADTGFPDSSRATCHPIATRSFAASPLGNGVGKRTSQSPQSGFAVSQRTVNGTQFHFSPSRQAVASAPDSTPHASVSFAANDTPSLIGAASLAITLGRAGKSNAASTRTTVGRNDRFIGIMFQFPRVS
jgi:GMP synthase-like glutamine amidotransferase